jgi:hypothetical protein
LIFPSHNAAIFIHAFNHRLSSIRRDLQELRAEKVHRVSNVWTGLSIAIIADFVISLAKLDRGPKGQLQVIGTMELDSISAFVY